jgi:hypothetical protein
MINLWYANIQIHEKCQFYKSSLHLYFQGAFQFDQHRWKIASKLEDIALIAAKLSSTMIRLDFWNNAIPLLSKDQICPVKRMEIYRKISSFKTHKAITRF